MPELNPYEFSQPIAAHDLERRSSLTACHFAAAAPGTALVLVAATKYRVAAQSLDGAMAGSILIVVGYVVGRVMASEATAGPVGIGLAGSFGICLCMGVIDHAGGEPTLWAFSCMCAGILTGACGPHGGRNSDLSHSSEISHSVEPSEAELISTGADEMARRN